MSQKKYSYVEEWFVRQETNAVISYTFLLSYSIQQTPITGIVTSSDDQQPLQGVSVTVKGTSTGTTTGGTGAFSLNAPADATLVFSFV